MLIEKQSGGYPFDQFLGTGGEDSDFQKNIFDFFPGIIYVYDTDRKQLRYVNKKITDVLGYSFDDVLLWENDLTKIVYNEDLEQVKKELARYNELQDTDTYGYRCRFNKKAGDCLHFHVTGKILKRNEAGKPASILFVAQNISDSVQSAEEAKAAKELINETEGLLQFGTWTWDIKTNKILWSNEMYTIYGYSSGDITGILNQDFIINHVEGKEREEVKKIIAASLNNKKGFEKEFSIIDHRGEEKKVYCKAKIIVDEQGDALKMLGITRCIKEQTRLYNDLLNYKEMILEKEEFLGHGSWEMNYADTSITWSDGMYRLFGYDPVKEKDDLVINEKFYRSHMAMYDLEKSREILESMPETDKTYLWEYEIKTKNGEAKKLETYAKIIRSKNGKPLQIIGTTRDVTKLRTYERELERKITELKRSNKDLEDFAYVASHDIQEPLRKIISFSERLKNKYTGELDEEAKRYLDRIMTATKSARQLIDGLMDFSRLTREEQSFEKADMNVLLQEVKTELELKIEETETILQTKSLPILEVVPVQIKQLLSNLLLNAIKFRKETVSPVIQLNSKKLSKQDVAKHHLDPVVSYYEITVEDNGIGFEEEYSERIFQMFQRLHGKAEYPGAGIGLALCKKIVENHHGLIGAKSQPEKGTVFSIILPETQG